MTTTQTISTGWSPAELEALKARLKTTWESGNFDFFSRYMESSSVEFLERLSIEPGVALLDVACGSGPLSLSAARRGARVSGIDIATNSIQSARGRARLEGLEIAFEEGDAEELPYPDATFDVVVSVFGAMFAPRPELVASELTRVVRPGGRIAMANWTKEGFIGQMLAAQSRFVAPAGMPSPVLWGDEATVRERLGAELSSLDLERVLYRFDYPFSPREVVAFFVEHYGPTNRAFATLPETERDGLRAALEALWSAHNQSTDRLARWWMRSTSTCWALVPRRA
jgi:2-polyprenyl-3-methyl-5-hydroxy-6-metoxy-1,4-benzoquinol methylase